MKATVRFETQVRRAAGVSSREIESPEPLTAEQLVKQIAVEANAGLREVLVDANGNVRSTILLFVNDQLVTADDPQVLSDGAELTITAPISGG